MAHGLFTSSDGAPECPMGCDTVERVFITPPGLKSDRTRNIDNTLQRLAKSYGLTDLNNRGGQAVAGHDKRASSQRERDEAFAAYMHERFGDGWGNVPKGKTMNAKTKEVVDVKGRNGPGGAGVFSEYGGAPDNALAEVAPALHDLRRPVLVKHDHEKLTVADAKASA